MGKSFKIRDGLHNLIDKTDNDELLEIVYQILNSKETQKENKLLNNLSAEEKKDLYTSYDESLNENSLIDLGEVKEKISKWQEK